MTDAEKLAAIRRILEIVPSYMTIDPDPNAHGEIWVVIDGASHVPASDAAVLRDLMGWKPTEPGR